MEKTVKVELTKAELAHLINDVISYIWNIKEQVFGDDWNFGTDITEVEELTPDQEKDLRSSGYYSRKELLDKLKKIEREAFGNVYNEVGE